MLNSLQACDGWGEGRGIVNILYQSLFGPVERYTPKFGPEEKHFVSGNFAGFSLYILSEGSAKLRWVDLTLFGLRPNKSKKTIRQKNLKKSSCTMWVF